MTKEQILALLARPDHPPVSIRLSADSKYQKLPVAEVRLIVERGDFHAEARRGLIRKLAVRTRLVTWQPCHRTQSAAVLPPSIEWLQSRETPSRTVSST